MYVSSLSRGWLAGWPPWLADPPPPPLADPPRDGWLGRSAFTLTKRTCFFFTWKSEMFSATFSYAGKNWTECSRNGLKNRWSMKTLTWGTFEGYFPQKEQKSTTDSSRAAVLCTRKQLHSRRGLSAPGKSAIKSLRYVLSHNVHWVADFAKIFLQATKRRNFAEARKVRCHPEEKAFSPSGKSRNETAESETQQQSGVEALVFNDWRMFPWLSSHTWVILVFFCSILPTAFVTKSVRHKWRKIFKQTRIQAEFINVKRLLACLILLLDIVLCLGAALWRVGIIWSVAAKTLFCHKLSLDSLSPLGLKTPFVD